MNDGITKVLEQANGSSVHIVLTTGLIVTTVTMLIGGSMWLGRLDQRIYDLERSEAVAVQLAQSTAAADAAHMQQFVIVEERQNEVLKRLDLMDTHFRYQDERINSLAKTK